MDELDIPVAGSTSGALANNFIAHIQADGWSPEPVIRDDRETYDYIIGYIRFKPAPRKKNKYPCIVTVTCRCGAVFQYEKRYAGKTRKLCDLCVGRGEHRRDTDRFTT